MSSTVILALGSGDFQKGFSCVTAEFKKQGETVAQYLGSLLPAPEVDELHKRWKVSCRATQHHRSSSRIKIKPAGKTNISEDKPNIIYEGLKKEMNKWLSADEFYRKIEVKLRTEISNRDELVEIFLECNNSEIWQLPWDVWQFREDYNNCEIIGSSPEYKKTPQEAMIGGIPLGSRGRILCVLGNSQGIDVSKDATEITKYLGDSCDLQFLQEPNSQELRNQLFDDKGWQVLFYAGHSDSDINGANGLLYINQEVADNTVTVQDFKEGLKRAIVKGLELLIFNSCSSMGIAADLVTEGISLPSVIVMRAPIPDFIAQEFVKSLFRYLALKEPLFLAVRKAKNDLLRYENQFPGASGIPMLCQHPTFEGLKLLELKCDRPFAAPTDDVAPVKRSYPVGNRPNHPQFTIPTKFMQRTSISLAGLAIGYPLIGPHLASAINTFGMKNHRNNQFLIAKASYNLAASINPTNGESSYNLSLLCDQLNEDECAREAMKQAVWRGLPEAYAQISRSLIIKNKPESALKVIGMCLEQTQFDGVKSACFKNRGWVRLNQKRYDAAETDLRKAISLSNKTPEAQCLLAKVLEAKGKPQEALTHWQETLKSANPSIPEQDECIQMAKERLPIIGKSQ
ncbi:CHAT domain-containing protein [Microcoleus sp. PH2017_28_MFU_U_A]|uniref:CHAT domain-containing protein n=1 Tax=Microcoleus sp. PH2017_28_MFU_U_A TaxID=2798838 RepID=UPI001D246E58|nr:CHAT domain-containing protein [Microcoleus sp. PH2017_28_MFU_U_A]MCC3589769.1 CHAT domain-containing protein [Microcoleus sp. PH2017_28_MFU_U_A]